MTFRHSDAMYCFVSETTKRKKCYLTKNVIKTQ